MSELKHHGIQGQRWGFRRYRNYDGTLTTEGKLRYYGDSEASNDSTSHLSNNELQQRINRMNLERQYHELSDISRTEMQEAVNRMNLERQYMSLTKEEMDRGRITVDKVLRTMRNVAAFLATGIAIQKSIQTIRNSGDKKD